MTADTRPITATSPGGGALAATAGRAALITLLNRLDRGHLEVVDAEGTTRTFGDPADELSATVTIRDRRAWSAVARRGSVGYGESYADGWWDTDDLVGLTRLLIRNLGTIDRWRSRWADLSRVPSDAWSRAVPRTDRGRDRRNISAHYDMGNEFFATFLDDTMTYSCAVFADPDESLERASNRKYDRILDKLGVGAGTTVLEIGSGWGGFATRASRSRGAEVTTTTISQAQYDYVLQRLADERVPGVTPLMVDWRDLPERGVRYDRVVSIEMIEAVDWRDYRRYFDAIERCLAPDGMVGLQAICLPDQRYEAGKRRKDFIKRHIFPGGMLPSHGALVESAVRRGTLQLLDIEDITSHYAETLRRWRERFDAAEDQLEEMGYDVWFRRLWRMYLAYCEAAFAERSCTVGQFVFVGPEWRGAPTAGPTSWP